MANLRRRSRASRAASTPGANAPGVEAAAAALNLRIDATLKDRVSRAAEFANLTLTDYVVRALSHLTDPPYSPWAGHPCDPDGSPRRGVVRGDDIFARDRELLAQATALSNESSDPVVVRLTVPRCLNIGQAELVEFKSWEDLSSDYVTAITGSRLRIRRLHIYDVDDVKRLPRMKDSRQSTQFESDRSLEHRLLDALADGSLTASPQSPDADGRVHFRYTTVSAVMGYPGRRSDREYLNDFNVYGSFAVSFSLETSFGLPYACMVSEFPADVNYWTKRFDDLFNRAQPGAELPAAPRPPARSQDS